MKGGRSSSLEAYFFRREIVIGYKEQGLPVINVPRGHLLFFIQNTIESAPIAYNLDSSRD